MTTITTVEATNQLRFVQRNFVFEAGKNLESQSIRVLQQAWRIISRDGEAVATGEIEWRDVPLAQEWE